MSVNDELGKRMKVYEAVSQHYLMKRTPVIIRVDMRAGHTFTKYLKRPWDNIFQQSMQNTMQFLCENVEHVKLGYCQSDEITLILVDYDTLSTEAWFNYRTDKLCSISASMATLEFNRRFAEHAKQELWSYHGSLGPEHQNTIYKYHTALHECMNRGAMFDARCFNIPVEEVTNLIYWRQLDATRNSIQMVAQANFSHKELQGLNTSKLQDKLMLEKGINWGEDYTITQKRGCCCIKNNEDKWIIDDNIPIFKGEGRDYIEKLIEVPK